MIRLDEVGRRFTTHASAEVKRDLATLARRSVSSTDYRAAFERLGAALGGVARAMIPAGASVAVVTTPEDADFLTKGLVEALDGRRIYLACYWATRVDDAASIHKRYLDPVMPASVDAVVIVKSIIASGCIVQAHLEEFLLRTHPRQVLITAPVILEGAEARLRRAFPTALSRRFEFLSFAVDSKTANNLVKPGIGGLVEKRLGLKPRFSPTLVGSWRKMRAGASPSFRGVELRP